MHYSKMLNDAIANVDLSHAQICRRMKLLGITANASYLSKLKNNRVPPASDKFNEVIAKVVGIEPIDLKTAAYITKLPSDVIERIKRMA